MPLYRRVRNTVTGAHYDKPVTSPLRDVEQPLKQPLTSDPRPPKHHVDKGGKPAPARNTSPAPAGGDTTAAEPANPEKE